jgi:hypothetical protein
MARHWWGQRQEFMRVFQTKRESIMMFTCDAESFWMSSSFAESDPESTSCVTDRSIELSLLRKQNMEVVNDASSDNNVLNRLRINCDGPDVDLFAMFLKKKSHHPSC